MTASAKSFALAADLDSDIDDAARDNDDERRTWAEAEREALIEELRRVTRTGGRARAFADHPAERAPKAVTGRIPDTIRKLEPVLPELAAHLESTIVTAPIAAIGRRGRTGRSTPGIGRRARRATRDAASRKRTRRSVVAEHV